MSKPGLFTSESGKSLLVPFALVSSLFAIWGFCNGMIDVMDKHFQKELGLTLAQSAWVQFAHYLGYFLIALPAGWLATKLGYKGGIIAGLLMVAVGGLWFIPATQIAQFWAFLLGVCVIASGLTFLETVANPYTTVLGPKQFAATRINMAQSCNGIGLIFGPIAGAAFFYGKDDSGASTGAEMLWIPYAAVAVVVLLLAVVFFCTKLPDIVTEDEFHLDDDRVDDSAVARQRPLALGLMMANILVLALSIGMIFASIAAIPAVARKFGFSEEEIAAHKPDNLTLLVAAGVLAVIGLAVFLGKKNRLTHHSIWSHPHFSAATLAQFFYVAAQTGIWAYFINYMTSQPPVPAEWLEGPRASWFELHAHGVVGFTDKMASTLASVGFGLFLGGRVIGAWLLKRFPAHRVLASFGIAAAVSCALVFLRLGWFSAVCVLLSYLFMSIMFPTIFSLGIHGLGSRAKKASSFIVMAIMGGAIMPKFMGHIGDERGLAFAFIVPICCFVMVTLYAASWSKLSGQDGVIGAKVSGGH